ncbi:SCP2 sterol-binding domain-containing protein [Anaerobacillus isosaccharinicus]|uniref:SCP2 sterol-binding domain-containing protein n=1 Tax=Anaerobacillus isosaccharinicus TaxID=1532552 RepID=A0A1S2KW24_9BACI|nr:SCP2 sterol-binding domain-containing protein [Anaerobacillus isosaccharinicus]MBA5584796.1 SCP2 sterol-binding domain-containing protein [Anaerobacillus isosaccharinicus]QOY36839.1 SCP2 sterol-binding domain-containing protein [Anaerobacillus isosaccharinicus]
MEFEQVLQGFQQRLTEASHLQTFFKEKQFVVLFEIGSNSYTISLSTLHGQVMENTDESQKIDLTIQADEEVIKKLLKGQDRLQRLAKQNQLTVHGTYPAILKAETIFYLNNVHLTP